MSRGGPLRLRLPRSGGALRWALRRLGELEIRGFRSPQWDQEILEEIVRRFPDPRESTAIVAELCPVMASEDRRAVMRRVWDMACDQLPSVSAATRAAGPDLIRAYDIKHFLDLLGEEISSPEKI